MAKRGRPVIEEPKCIKVGFRVTKKDRDRLFAYCEKKDLTQGSDGAGVVSAACGVEERE